MVRYGREEEESMAVPRAQRITVTVRQGRVLDQVVRASTSPQALATRARVVLAAAEGRSNRQIAMDLGVTRNLVQAWRGRWAAAGDTLLAAELEGGAGDERALQAVVRGVLADAPRSGAPPTFTPEQLCRIIALACTPPSDAGRPISHWTPRELADEAASQGIVPRISARTVGRLWVVGRGRTATAPEPVLAHARAGRPDRVRRPGADGV
jgi:Homeodomain-like domain